MEYKGRQQEQKQNEIIKRNFGFKLDRAYRIWCLYPDNAAPPAEKLHLACRLNNHMGKKEGNNGKCHTWVSDNNGTDGQCHDSCN